MDLLVILTLVVASRMDLADFRVRDLPPDDMIIPLLKKFTQKRQPRQFKIGFHGSIGTNHNNDCKKAGSCSFGGGNSRPGVTTTNTHVNGKATFDTDFNGSVETSHISDCKRTGSCQFGKKKRSIETNEA